MLPAETIQNPDEIWWFWEEFPKGRMTLVRRYIARFEVDGKKAQAISVFDVGEEGWVGVTAFPADRESYIRNQRLGTLAYRRPK